MVLFDAVPRILLIIASVLIVLVPFLIVWVPVRAIRARRELKRMLEDQGHRVMRMELRWLTRGPFHDMNPSGTKYGDWLYRIVAEDQERRRYVGWIRWRPSRPWQSLDRWAVEWEDDSQRPSKGIGSLAFGALVAAAVSVPITLIAATVLQSH